MPDDENSSTKWDNDSDFIGDVYILVARGANGKVIEIARYGDETKRCPIVYSIQTQQSDSHDGPCDEANFSAVEETAIKVLDDFAKDFKCPGNCPIKNTLPGYVGKNTCDYDAVANSSIYYVVAAIKVECHSA